MTVASAPSFEDTVADGNSVIFPFTMRTLHAEWIEVYLDDEVAAIAHTVTLNADQSVDPGGEVTFAIEPINGTKVSIRREIPLAQELVLDPFSAFPSKSVERALDRVVMQQQGVAAYIDRREAVVRADFNVLDDAAATMAAVENAAIVAAASAQDAADEVINATAQAAAAVAAKVAAEAARDAALIGDGAPYPDEPTGRAAVADGAAFPVQGSGEVAKREYRRINAGASTLIATYPSKAAIDTKMSVEPDAAYAFAFVDEEGRAALGVLEDGTAVAARLEPTILATGGVEAEAKVDADFVWAVTDDAGAVALGVKTDGEVVAGDLVLANLNGAPADGSIAADPARLAFDAEIVHIIAYGQSLSEGHGALPVLTTVQRHNSLRFVGGVRPTDGGSYASLVPLLETSNGTDGETPTGGTLEAVHDLILAENSLAFDAHSFQLLGSAAGEDGKTVAQLSKGSAYFTELIAHVTNGLARANALGKTYQVGAVTWTQGENDVGANTPAATYIASLRQLVVDLNTDIKTITGQTKDIPLICYQPATHKFYGKDPIIAQALVDAADVDPLIHFATPLYWLTHLGDNLHLTALSSKIMGAYYGLVFKRVVVDGGTWAHLKIKSTMKQGSVVVLTFDVPTGPLVFDTTLVTQNTNYGFELVDSGGGALAISTVELLGDNRVKITAAAPVPAGAKVRYAWSGAGTVGPINGVRGNLRDSQGEEVAFDPTGLAVKLHNWCPIFTIGV